MFWTIFIHKFLHTVERRIFMKSSSHPAVLCSPHTHPALYYISGLWEALTDPSDTPYYLNQNACKQTLSIPGDSNVWSCLRTRVLDPCHSKCYLKSSIIGTTREIARNIKSKAPSQNYRVRICNLKSDLSAHSSKKDRARLPGLSHQS